jgi:hypothetical protein
MKDIPRAKFTPEPLEGARTTQKQAIEEISLGYGHVVSITAVNGAQALDLLRELMDNGDAFYSAIELHHGFDGEDWGERAKELLK